MAGVALHHGEIYRQRQDCVDDEVVKELRVRAGWILGCGGRDMRQEEGRQVEVITLRCAAWRDFGRQFIGVLGGCRGGPWVGS